MSYELKKTQGTGIGNRKFGCLLAINVSND